MPGPTIPVAFTDATPIVAADLGSDLQAVRKWLNGGIAVADLVATPWLDRQHVVRPSYNGITNTFYFVSGIQAGQQYGTTPTFAVPRYTYMTQGNSDPLDGKLDTTFVPVPGTGMTFTVPRSCNVLYQIVAYPHTYGSAGDQTRARFVLDRTTANTVDAGCLLWNTPDQLPIGYKLNRQPWSYTGMALIAAGDHTFEMVASSNCAKTMLVAWSISMEVRWA